MIVLRMTLASLLALFSINAQAQSTVPPASPTASTPQPPKHEPPPNAYADCKGKKVGDEVQHRTPEGVVPATCVDSPRGLVARPLRPPQKQAPK